MFETKQFILSKITSNGDKLPCNAAGEVINAHDPQHWMTYDEVVALAATNESWRPAFVLTDNDPYFCIDIDYCLIADENQQYDWSPLSKKICAMFPGAMVEVSQSGKALHIWGRASVFPKHACKNTKLHLELYHTKRFIVLGSNAAGDVNLDQTANLTTFINTYMPPRVEDGGGQFNWTTSPVDEWDGPEDDEELIQRMLRATGAASVFGGSKALTFEALWNAEEDILAAEWPHDTKGYDGSSADMSLAQRLAFWTGKDCQRMERLMRQSALVRDKWDTRPDYLRRTILNACGAQTKVYTDPRKAEKKPLSKKFAGGWVSQNEIPEVFAGCIYVVKHHSVLTPEGLLLKPEQFKVVYGGYTFSISDQRTTRNAFEAFTECPTWRPPQATDLCFRPELPPLELVEESGVSMVNMYRPVPVPSKPGDVSRLEKLLTALYPVEEDRKILQTYMAACVQHVGYKFQWAPLLQGPQGNGKTFLVSCLQEAVGRNYTHTVNAFDIAGNGAKFNAWLFGKVFIVIEEVKAANSTVMDIMKPMITNSRIEIQAKGKDQKESDNRANFILTSNHMDALLISNDDRRYAPLASALRSERELSAAGLTPAFFADLWDWARGTGKYAGKTPGYAHVTHWLQNYDLDARFNPAGQCVRAPKTSSLDKFIASSLSRPQQELLEAVEQGMPGFAGGWVSTTAFASLLESRRLAGRLSYRKREEMLEEMGYLRHPALPDGRATAVCQPDQKRPRLFVKEGHLALNENSPTKVMVMYNEAQIKAMRIGQENSQLTQTSQ